MADIVIGVGEAVFLRDAVMNLPCNFAMQMETNVKAVVEANGVVDRLDIVPGVNVMASFDPRNGVMPHSQIAKAPVEAAGVRTEEWAMARIHLHPHNHHQWLRPLLHQRRLILDLALPQLRDIGIALEEPVAVHICHPDQDLRLIVIRMPCLPPLPVMNMAQVCMVPRPFLAFSLEILIGSEKVVEMLQTHWNKQHSWQAS